MSRLFVGIYEWFRCHTKTFYAILVAVVAICAAMASQLSFKENITNFFDSSKEGKGAIFDNVKAKDKIIVMISGNEPDSIIESAIIFEQSIKPLIDKGLVNSITSVADEEMVSRCTSFVYDYLPIFLTEEDYTKLEKSCSEEGVDLAVNRAYNLLVSPSGLFVGDVVMQDPLNIGTPLLQKFEQFNPNLQYEIYDGRLFTRDLKTLLMFVEPSSGMGDTGKNDELVSRLEEAEAQAEAEGIEVEFTGGPVIAVYNARQIKQDTSLTLGLALIFILLVIFLSFRSKWSIPFIIVPPAFGALFALAMVWLVQGEISAIALGAGAVVLGVSLSYSIHIVAHLNHISSPKEIIEELTTPLTIGCFTTIGAFAALMFTSSPLLRDMGLFALFALIGTTLFCLIFLPQFLKVAGPSTKSPLLSKIERLVGYRYDGNRWVVLPIVAITVAALFFYTKVEFDDNMSHINYMPEHIAEAESRSAEIFGAAGGEVYVVTSNHDFEKAAEEYTQLGAMLEEMKSAGAIERVVTIGDFVVSPEEQNRRIARWNKFWSEHRETTLSYIAKSAEKCGFKSDAFARFDSLISRDFSPCSYSDEIIGEIPVISEWVNSSNGSASLLCRISLAQEKRDGVYSRIEKLDNTAVIDRGYFSSKMVESTSNDFNYILLVSSLIVFIALFISYGRIELTLLTFLPMAVSWVIILGMMALFDIKFNIVNIILATFIFGIGDDFSIFIMDGLLYEYKSGKKMLGAHKTAIFFSAFTAIVGMGVLIFAQHPALKSIALISVLGLSVVVLVSYTIQPLLFGWLVTSQTKRGGVPYTIGNLLNTIYCLVYFLIGCIVIHILMLLIIPLPIKRVKKKLALHKMIYWFLRIFFHTMITVKVKRLNPYGEKYDKPAVIVANHQSLIDVMLLLSTTPKVVMITNRWVWNSPFFGWIVRYADFHHSETGYEVLAEKLRERVAEGYSVVIFPEGTRSTNTSILRFHKGAFYLAQLLKLDILPVVIYGAGHVLAKHHLFHINSGTVATKTMKRVAYGDTSFGETYQEQAKSYRRWFIEQCDILSDELGRTQDGYYRRMLMRNYTYKGPMLEWRVRMACRKNSFYDEFDRLIPRDATIADMGCGYGQVAYMLSLLSPKRSVWGVDCNEEMIEVAQRGFLSGRYNVRFECADMRNVDIPQSDVVLFCDSLQCVAVEYQLPLLNRAVRSLNERGVIVVCDRSDNEALVSNLHEVARSNNMKVDTRPYDADSSKTLYILIGGSDEKV